jgi:hypothetical protein
VRLEGLCKLKKFNDLIGIRTRDLPACSIVSQPTTLFYLIVTIICMILRYVRVTLMVKHCFLTVEPDSVPEISCEICEQSGSDTDFFPSFFG